MTRGAEWTPEAVGRLWDYLADRPDKVDEYFSKQVGPALVRVLATATPIAGRRCLDYGCGPGFLAERLLEQGAWCAGFDQSERSRAAAEARLGTQERWLGASPSIEAAAFDVVTCIETLEHLDDAALDVVLSDVRRLVRPGGVALFTTPHAEAIEYSLVFCPFCDTEFHPVQHVRSFSAESLRESLVAHGFQVEWMAGIDLLRLMPDATPWRKVTPEIAVRRLRRRVGHVFDKLLPRDGQRAWSFRADLARGPHLCAIVRLQE